MSPNASDVRVFVPSKNFALSADFYEALGWSKNWSESGLAEFELAEHRFFLQDFFVKDWAHNFMIHVTVDDAAAWHQHVSELLGTGRFGEARCEPPKDEPYGALVCHVWDPCGVLIHLAQPVEKPAQSTD